MEDIDTKVLTALALFDGNKTAAAEYLGMPRTTFRRQLEAAQGSTGFGLRNNPSDYFGMDNMGDPQVTRIAVIGDIHSHPKLPQDRFEWIAKHIEETQPDRVVQIGDIADFEGLCSHIKPGTVAKFNAPTFEDELEHLEEGLSYWGFTRDIPTDITLGNHDIRPFTYENMMPELRGTFGRRFIRLLNNADMSITNYGQSLNVSGVGFTHSAYNTMGKPIGGKNPEISLAREATHDWVCGHTHKLNVLNTPKVGQQNRVRVFNVGTALPWGYTFPYANHAAGTTGWWWGVVELTVYNNRVEGFSYKPMLELEKRYSK